VWQDPVFSGQAELGPDGLRRCLDQLRGLGVDYIDFTGGEPVLHSHLAMAVRHASEIGMRADVTTNAITFGAHAASIVPYADTVNISIDTLSAERYHAIRGTDTLDRTVTLIERLRREGAANLKLITVVTSQSLPGLDDVIGFAQRHQVPIYLSPMFTYFEGQGELRDPARTARSLRLLEVNGRPADVAIPQPALADEDLRRLLGSVRAHAHTPYTVVNLAFLRHVDTLDPSAPTACGAGSRIVTIGPDGDLLLPCYHEWDTSLAWDRPYRELIEDREFIRVRDEEVGQRPGCRRCAVFPYLGLAMSYRLTAGFLAQAVSEEIGKIKSWVQRLGDDRGQDRSGLPTATDELLGRLEGRTLRPGTHLDELYYFAARRSAGAVSDLAAGAVAVEEVLADHVHEDCWRAQRTPHRLARLLYTDILPALVALADSGHGDAARLASISPQIHLALWNAWLDRFPIGSQDGRDGRSAPGGSGQTELSAWCGLAGDLLAAAGQQAAARSVAALALLSGLPVRRLAAWGGLAGHPEELYLANLVRDGLPARRREALAPCFGPLVAARLTTAAHLATPLTTARRADLRLAARGDPAELGALRAMAWRQCYSGDTTAFRALVRSWKAAAARGDPVLAERMLLAAKLGMPMSGQVPR
jgi:MoaA/NifB/PqqE/SkfB family radical SAM enzyme